MRFMSIRFPKAVQNQVVWLIDRRIDDEGIVVVLTSAYWSRRYGSFIAALPECTTLRQRVCRLPNHRPLAKTENAGVHLGDG